MSEPAEIADRLNWIAKEEDLAEDLSLRTVETIKQAAVMLCELEAEIERLQSERRFFCSECGASIFPASSHKSSERSK